MRSTRAWMAAGVVAVCAASVCFAELFAPPEPPPAGTFSGEGLTLMLKRKGDAYTGLASVGSAEYELTGTFDHAKGLLGTFINKGATYAWSASVDGKILRFETGGTTYAMAIPAAPASPENPLAKKPDGAAKPAAPAAAKPEECVLKFTRLSIKDPQMNNMEAISYLIPEGWQAKGGIVWFPDHIILANLLMTITDPATGAQIEFLPMQHFTWVDQPVMPMTPGQNYMGKIVSRPPGDVPEFIRAFNAPQAMAQLQHAKQTGIEELRKVAEQVSAAWGGQARVMSSKVRYEYERSGKAWEEDVFVTLVVNSQQGMTIWSVNSAYSFRAPKGELDKVAPKMATIVSTGRITQDWYGGYMYVQQLFMDRMNQGIKNAAAISATVTKNSEEIRKMFGESYRKQQESQDRTSRGFSEYVRGVQTYENPYDSRPVQLPSGYRDAWVSASGEYLLSTQAGFDPNVGATVEWKRMGVAP